MPRLLPAVRQAGAILCPNARLGELRFIARLRSESGRLGSARCSRNASLLPAYAAFHKERALLLWVALATTKKAEYANYLDDLDHPTAVTDDPNHSKRPRGR